MKINTLNNLFPELKKNKGFIIFLDPDRKDVWTNPDKMHKHHLEHIIECQDYFTSVIIGGSTGVTEELMDISINCLLDIGYSQNKIGLIPSHHTTFSKLANYAVMPLLLNSTDQYFRFDFIVKSIDIIKNYKLSIVPTAYLLVEPADQLTVGKVTKPDIIKDCKSMERYCEAAKMLGLETISLEAGSGASYPVSSYLVKCCRDSFDGTITVGGGIKTPEQVTGILSAGADVIIIGDAIEKSSNPKSLIKSIGEVVRTYS